MINGKSQRKTCFNLPVPVTGVTEKCELSFRANKECLDYPLNLSKKCAFYDFKENIKG